MVLGELCREAEVDSAEAGTLIPLHRHIPNLHQGKSEKAARKSKGEKWRMEKHVSKTTSGKVTFQNFEALALRTESFRAVYTDTLQMDSLLSCQELPSFNFSEHLFLRQKFYWHLSSMNTLYK